MLRECVPVTVLRQPVLAPHPVFDGTYAPGRVHGEVDDNTVTVVFYDGLAANTPRRSCHGLPDPAYGPVCCGG